MTNSEFRRVLPNIASQDAGNVAYDTSRSLLTWSAITIVPLMSTWRRGGHILCWWVWQRPYQPHTVFSSYPIAMTTHFGDLRKLHLTAAGQVCSPHRKYHQCDWPPIRPIYLGTSIIVLHVGGRACRTDREFRHSEGDVSGYRRLN